MNKTQKLRQLADIADFIKERELDAVRLAAEKRSQTQALITGLEQPQGDDLPPLVAAQAAQTYERWADLRRQELNITLARQTAAWMQAQDKARHSFGRAQALGQLRDKYR